LDVGFLTVLRMTLATLRRHDHSPSRADRPSQARSGAESGPGRGSKSPNAPQVAVFRHELFFDRAQEEVAPLKPTSGLLNCQDRRGAGGLHPPQE
jgi:hypothetical protein